MNRTHMTEQIKRIRRDEDRDPLDKAFYAVASLTDQQRAELVKRLNATFDRCTPPKMFSFQIEGAK